MFACARKLSDLESSENMENYLSAASKKKTKFRFRDAARTVATATMAVGGVGGGGAGVGTGGGVELAPPAVKKPLQSALAPPGLARRCVFEL